VNEKWPREMNQRINEYRAIKQELLDKVASRFEYFAIYDVGSDGGIDEGPLKYLEKMPNSFVVSCDIRTENGEVDIDSLVKKPVVRRDERKVLVEGGIGPSRGIMPFYVANKGQVSSLLKSDVESIRCFDGNLDRFRIKSVLRTHVYTLTEVAETTGHAPDFLKIDIQGMEFMVIRSARDILEQNSPYLLVETNNQNYYIGQASFGENVSLAEDLGYRILDMYPIYNSSCHGRVFTFADILYGHRDALRGDQSSIAKEIVRAIAYGKDFLGDIQAAIRGLNDRRVYKLFGDKLALQREIMTETEEMHVV